MQKTIIVLALLFALTTVHAETTEIAMSSEQRMSFVEALFAAAAGTTADGEKTLRSEMTEEEIQQRIAECAEYRAMTLPWLVKALTPPEEALQPEASPAPSVNPDAEMMEFVWTPDAAWTYFQMTEKGQQYIKILAELGYEDAESALQKTNDLCQAWMAEIDAETLKVQNDDYACWLYSADSQIDYPVVQGEDNKYYLNHLFNGARNSCGTLFIDYRNLPEFEDPNTLIYGHHMRNGSMFKAITFYCEQEYYDAHPWMLVITPGEISILELFAGYVTDKSDHCYDIAISDEADQTEFVETALIKSNFVSDVEIVPGDRLVTLSTCAYAFENARYIAIGRLNTIWTAEREVISNE